MSPSLLPLTIQAKTVIITDLTTKYGKLSAELAIKEKDGKDASLVIADLTAKYDKLSKELAIKEKDGKDASGQPCSPPRSP